MSSKVDVHILTLPDQNQTWYKQCLQSLENQPINLYVVDGIVGKMGEARRNGFSRGSAEFVAFVDPDDIVQPGAFEACVSALQANTDASMSYTREVQISKDGFLLVNRERDWYEPHFGKSTEPFHAHHLSVFRRSMLPDLTFLDNHWHMADVALRKEMYKSGPFVFVDMIGYQWRRYQGQSSRTPLLQNAETQQIAKEWMEARCKLI